MLRVLKVLADPTRLRLLRILQQGDFTVQDLMQILDMGQSRISRHLKLMTEAGLLQVEKQGTWHYYRLAPSDDFFVEIRPAIETHLNGLECLDADRTAMLKVLAGRRLRSQQFFDQHAHDWDLMHVDLLALPDYQSELATSIPDGGLILEIGVGTGQLLPLLAERGTHVIGVDHSPAMVEVAREFANRFAPDKVEVRLAEMVHLPVTASSVQTVVMNQVLHHAESPALVFLEIARILKPGGLLVVADLLRHDLDWVREQLADQWLGFTEKELNGWLDEAGLKMTRCQVVGSESKQQNVLLLMAEKRTNR